MNDAKVTSYVMAHHKKRETNCSSSDKLANIPTHADTSTN